MLNTSSWLIYNPAAGAASYRALIPEIAQEFQRKGWQIVLHETNQRGDVGRLAGEAARQGIAVVLVAGGDGSLNEAVNALAHTPTILGAIPTGTSNVWARQMKTPLPTLLKPRRLLESARALADGAVRRVDLGRAGEAYFLMWSGIGLDAQVSATIEPKPPIIRRFGIVGYAAHVVVVASRYRGVEMEIETEQETIHTNAILAVASNGRRYAAFFNIAPAAVLDDGYLNLTLFPGTNLYHTLSHALLLILGKLEKNPKIYLRQVQRIRIACPQACPVHVDGDPLTTTPITIEVVPGALKVLVPQQAPADLFSHERLDE